MLETDQLTCTHSFPESSQSHKTHMTLGVTRCAGCCLGASPSSLQCMWQQGSAWLCACRRVIHRDLKPENILMDESMNVKIADFGLAGITTPFSGNLRQLCGTPEFTAPEIVQGKEYSGPAVDIWSLGVILYELLQVCTQDSPPRNAACTLHRPWPVPLFTAPC